MKHRIAISVLLGGALVGLIALGTARTVAQSDARAVKTDPRLPKAEKVEPIRDLAVGDLRHPDRVAELDDHGDPKPLTFSGRGNLSLASGDLIFIPEGKAIQRVMGLPVIFDVEGRSAETSEEEQFFDFVGEVQMRFDLVKDILTVSAQGDDGSRFAREFDLFTARAINGGPVSTVVASYFAYMATGTYPVVAVEGSTASGPFQSLNNCSCDTTQCSHSQSCPNSQECKCSCQGSSCRCWCAAS